MKVRFIIFSQILILSLFSSCKDNIANEDDNNNEEINTSKDYDENDCQPWKDFVEKNENNVLLDFSYAGYKHGEEEPVDIWTLGYKKYNIADYGAIPNDGKSDRAAFLAVLKEVAVNINFDDPSKTTKSPNARAIIYFPPGEYMLYTKEDGEPNTIDIPAGHIILKGAGRDKTTIYTKDPLIPYGGLADGEYAGPLIQFKYNSSGKQVSKVADDSPKGSFTIKLESTTGLAAGEWIRLELNNNSQELIDKELYPFEFEDRMTQVKEEGVQIWDVHQIVSIKDNVVRLKEPLMHAVEAKWGWVVSRYDSYSNIGIEDLCFKGNMGAGFTHGDIEASTAYVPLLLMRVSDSWIRRVDFESVSTAVTLTQTTNVSVYDIKLSGQRGHCSVNTAAATRSFFGKIVENIEYNGIQNAGQHHAVGVAKQSIGTVIWRCQWGLDTNSEAHARQPRATLIDCCKGGFARGHQGGADFELPNHWDDLTLWNFEATKVPSEYANNWTWWGPENHWRFLPPTIVGFHGQTVKFNQEQVKIDCDNGKIVTPESLYEAQLKKRLGFVPNWLIDLK